MEGPLSKWTNMVHGWQYRWFRLEEDVLLYYTSREKMLKGQQRGECRFFPLRQRLLFIVECLANQLLAHVFFTVFVQ